MDSLPSLHQIRQCRKQTDWDFGNSILYDLCRNNFGHTQTEIILAKIWLIGRSYSVSLERRKNKLENSDDFYVRRAVPAFKNVGLDKLLGTLKQHERITSDNALEVLTVHGQLTKVLKELTDQDKRSFSSKYLHFHLPELFFMYDSRAVIGLRRFISRVPRDLQPIVDSKAVDMEYAKFVCKCIALRQQIEKHFGQELENCELKNRELDNLLLYIADHLE